jgi:beta-galactosidase
MEDIGQNYGYILYRTTLKAAGDGDLDPRSAAQLCPRLSRRRIGRHSGSPPRQRCPFRCTSRYAGQQLDILVENSGRVNFSIVLRGERAGITKQVLWRGEPVEGWSIYPLPMEATDKIQFSNEPCTGPCFYQGHFTLAKPGDTFLDVRALGKGAVWINGHAIGRYWDIGPQETLYVPGVWLKEGDNEIVIFDMEGKSSVTLSGLDHPLLDGPVHETTD